MGCCSIADDILDSGTVAGFEDAIDAWAHCDASGQQNRHLNGII